MSSNDNQPTAVAATSLDITEHNLQQLKALFPAVFTEGKIDFDALKAELGEQVETANERYQFTWAGKEQAKRIATTPTLGTLRPVPEESVAFDSTENLYIEGDNLEVLKLLQKSYFNQVKMIYIDPPYNTGKDFVYKDDFKDNLANYQRLTGQRDEEGNPLFTNSDSAGRYHSNWLNMMYPRLKLARNLLRDDGVIFISIDDNEVHNLRKICDEIFGEDNFVANQVWQSRTSISDDHEVSMNHNHTLIYAKNYLSLKFYGERLNESEYDNRDSDHRGPWKLVPIDANKPGGNTHYPILNPSTGQEFWPPAGRSWAINPEEYQRLYEDGRIAFGVGGESAPKRKLFLNERLERGDTRTPSSILLNAGTTKDGSKEVSDLFGKKKIFSYPKSTAFIQRMIQYGVYSEKNRIILDFFSGSSTTAHAVMQLNAEDGGNRKFIMVQIPEPTPENSEARKAGYATIAEIGKERIRRAASKIQQEHPDAKADFGFKVLKLDTSNIKKWQPDFDNLEQDLLGAVDNIVPGRSSHDLLYEVLIKYGLPLTLPVEQLQIHGHTLYNVANGSLVACFDEGITLETIQAIIALGSEEAPILRVVFRDGSFADDIVKTNAIQRFKQAGIEDVLSI